MDAPSRGISRRTCMGMMMSALLGCRGSATLHAESPPEIAITIDDFDLNASTPLLDPDARNAQILDALRGDHFPRLRPGAPHRPLTQGTMSFEFLDRTRSTL